MSPTKSLDTDYPQREVGGMIRGYDTSQLFKVDTLERIKQLEAEIRESAEKIRKIEEEEMERGSKITPLA